MWEKKRLLRPRSVSSVKIPQLRVMSHSVYLRVSKYYGTATAAAVCDYMPAEENCIELFEKVGVDFEAVDKFVAKNYPKWIKVPKITEFYRKAFPVACYINYETKSAFILTRTLETAEFRYLQCSVPVFLPWYFEGENALKEADMKLIESLTKKYACLGNYQRTINECLLEHDYISAIEQCVASCKSLNFGDYTVMDTFMDKMYRGTQKCIVLPSGETVTIKKAVEWLNTEGENESEQAD